MIIPQPASSFVLFSTVFVRTFLPWYYLERPRQIILLYIAYARTFAEIFSFLFLVKTLISPWKSITDSYPSNMLQLGKIIQVLTLNMTARGVGFVIRIVTICIGLCVQVAVLAFFLCYLILWISFPALAVAIVMTLFPQLFA